MTHIYVYKYIYIHILHIHHINECFDFDSRASRKTHMNTTMSTSLQEINLVHNHTSSIILILNMHTIHVDKLFEHKETYITHYN